MSVFTYVGAFVGAAAARRSASDLTGRGAVDLIGACGILNSGGSIINSIFSGRPNKRSEEKKEVTTIKTHDHQEFYHYTSSSLQGHRRLAENVLQPYLSTFPGSCKQ